MKFVIVKTTVGTREAYQHHLAAHLGYLEELRAQNQLLSVGSYDDRTGGLIFVEVDGLEEALEVAQRDPLVEAGVESYLVRGWVPTMPGESTPQLELSLSASAGPIEPHPSEESFRVVDAAADARFAKLLETCLPAAEIPPGDAVRADFLRRVGGRGHRKLLLLHEDKVAGQIELAPPEASGLPITGDGVVVIHCLWVSDAYSGLDGGQLLLAACAETTKAASLATIAFNATLPWMSRSYFEAQGFAVIDQAATGRFCGSTPIVAYLLWRPLLPDVPAPSWDRSALAEGVSFCPRYPWLAGKRLYWGDRYDYVGVLVTEGLRRPGLLDQLPCLETRRTEPWTLVKFGLPAADLNNALELIQASLIAEPTYYAQIYNADRLIVVYPDRIFHATPDRASWAEAVRYGRDKGVPEDELVFVPNAFDKAFPGRG